MDTTLNAINAEVLRQLGYISYDEDCMQKVLKYLKKLVAKKEKAEEEEPVMHDQGGNPCTLCRSMPRIKIKPRRENQTQNMGGIKT